MNIYNNTGSSVRHILDLDTFSKADIELVLKNATTMEEVLKRGIKKVPVLRGKTIVTLFYESSTRTRASFEQAGKILSADVINVSSSTSSANKGESLYNTALTLQAMKADIIIIRHPDSGAPNFIARHLESSVINAGDGMHAHPTQGLLDLFTITKNLGSVDGKKVVIVGDVLYSRVARSNIWGLTKMGARVVLCGPRTLIPNDFLNGHRAQEGHPFGGVEVETNLEKAIENADVVMALRLQLERQRAGHLPSIREYSQQYGINKAKLSLANQNVILMHPGPMNEGIEIESDAAHGQYSMVEEQVTNGVAVRMALLHSLASDSNHPTNSNSNKEIGI